MYLDFFSSALREMPRFSALAAAVLKQAEDLQALVRSLPEAFSLPSAAGVQLDALGAALGLPRPEGAGDEAYRAWMQARLRLFRWDGTNESVPALLSEIAPGACLEDHGDGSVTVTLAGPLPGSPEACLPVPAGIHLMTEGDPS
ncbi:MAG: DUF2612 domain-containing protein [Clostridia bacterium]|nr:DUF2612 domain-containing protein [Clostridia bacterium]